VACRDHLSKINSNVKVVPIADALDSSNAKAILRGVDVILDGLDNNGTRLAINDAAVKLGVPLIYGGVMGEYGSAMPSLKALSKSSIPLTLTPSAP